MDEGAPLRLIGPVYEYVPEGFYSVVYVKHSFDKAFKGSHKLRVVFRIVDEGPSHAVELFWFCNVKKGNKSYQARQSSKVARQLRTLFGRDALRGGLQVGRLKGMIFRARTRTVGRDSTNSLLHENNHYSVIDELKEIIS